MKDPALETRARALSSELRCLVCQNESIDDSEAPLARDIRILIRERIGKGESNDSVRDYLVSRYGDFILLKPPFKPETLLLWLSPVLTLGLGVAAALYARRRAPSATPRLSEEEEARLAALTAATAASDTRAGASFALPCPRVSSSKGFRMRAAGAVSLLALVGALSCAGAAPSPPVPATRRSRRKSDFPPVRPAGPIAARRPCLSASSRAGRPFRRR